MWFIITIIALILFAILMIVDFFYLLSIGRSEGFFYKLAYNLDIFGNSQFADLFNAALITKDSKYEFGKPKDTISKVLGMNLYNNTLTKTGKVVVFILTKNHCLNAARKHKVTTNIQLMINWIKNNISATILGVAALGSWVATIYNLHQLINYKEEFQLAYLWFPIIATGLTIFTYKTINKK